MAGFAPTAIALVELCIAVLVGLEAPTLRRFTLSQRNWKNIGLVSGDTLEDAERRFFDAWVHEARASHPRRRRLGPLLNRRVPHMPQAPDVIGLFPDPGAGR